MSTLIVAEKPSVARDIARVLGCKTRAEGALRGETYVVTWAIGHLVTLCEPDEIDPRYKKWRAEDLPILPEVLPTKVLPKTKSQFAVVKALMNARETERIVCATDSGREGELIFRYIYEQAKCKKPVDRLWISSMTDAAIREGFAKLRPDSDYDALHLSARCRAEADWLVGMNASRAFTLKYGALLSVGRVQTPTLKLIAERDEEIRSFLPEDYWEIRADFGDYQGLWQDPEKKDGRCRDAGLAARVKAETEGQSGTVIEARREEKNTPPPQLYDLTALQRDANRLFGYSAAKTLELAQALYEKHKLITYPRTDSRYLPRDMIGKVKKTLVAFGAPYAAFAERLLPDPPTPARVYNDRKVSDHHAIVPTGQQSDLGRLPDAERRLFDLVARRLIAALYPDYRYESAVVTTQVKNHLFRTTGQTPLVEGWKALYKGVEKADEVEQKVPQLAVGDVRTAQAVTLKAMKTKPPSAHTDASLLGLMEHAGRAVDDEALKEALKDSGLGTPATRAAVIERLIAVGYVVRNKKALSATEKGLRLMQVVPAQIASPEMTGRWERALSALARETDRGLISVRAERFMGSIRRYAAFLVEAARAADASVRFEQEPRKAGKGKARVTTLGRACPLCGQGEVTANQKAFGCSRWQEGCRFTIWRDQLTRQGGPAIGVNDMKKLLDGHELTVEQGILKLVQGRLTLSPRER
ncbi:MAG: DNA topoisomerase 3 [Christensenellaceae bacterium]|nr:DNA topoisomerase 3 [Christensenellaceae bacterium]MEA5069337.1 DNA topoisomerase 3 [Christensenellaceae bacterium]